MKYKNIKSVLHNFGDSFTSDSNVVAGDVALGYLARRAIRMKRHEFHFDILRGTSVPVELASPPIDASVTAYTAWLPKLLESQNVHRSVLSSASLLLTFDLTRVSTSIGFPDSSEMPVDCIVSAADDRGKEHVVMFRRWLTFYDTDPDHRGRRVHSTMR